MQNNSCGEEALAAAAGQIMSFPDSRSSLRWRRVGQGSASGYSDGGIFPVGVGASESAITVETVEWPN